MVNYERLGLLTQAIAESDRYTFDAYCEEHDLYKKGKEFKAGGVWIACPFHGDLSPSLSFNEEKGIWHCFGCGAGGTLVDFMYLHSTKVLGHEISKVNYLNNLLKEDELLQVQLGFSSVVQQTTLTLDSLELLEKPKFTVKGVGTSTFSELQEKFMKTNPSLAEIKFFIALMQGGLPVGTVEKELMGQNTEKEEKKYDFSSMDYFS